MHIILIVPGWLNSEPAHWQSLWEAEYPNCTRVIQDDWEKADCTAWVRKLEETVQAKKGPIIFVAHSLGCSTVIHWADRNKKSTKKIKGALLVAPPDPSSPAMRELPFKGFEKLPLHRLPFRSIIVMSSNDPYCSLERARLFAASLGSELVDIGPKGHINVESKLGDWKEGKALLNKLLADID